MLFLTQTRGFDQRRFLIVRQCGIDSPFHQGGRGKCTPLLRVYRGRITLTRGIFSKCERELFMKDIRSIDIDQTFLGRLVDIGDISIASAASADAVEFVEGVPDPQHIRDLIIAQRQAS